MQSTSFATSQASDPLIIETAINKRYYGGEEKVKEGAESLLGKTEIEAMFGTKFSTNDTVKGTMTTAKYEPQYYYTNNSFPSFKQERVELSNTSQVYVTLAGRYNFIAKNQNFRIVLGLGAEGALRYSSPESDYLSFALYEAQYGLNSRLSMLYLTKNREYAFGPYAQFSAGIASTYLKFHGTTMTSRFEETTIYGKLYSDAECENVTNAGNSVIQAKSISPSYNSPTSKGQISPYWSYAVGMQARFSSGLILSLGVLTLHLENALPVEQSMIAFKQSVGRVEFDPSLSYYGIQPDGTCSSVGNSFQITQKGQLFNIDTSRAVVGVKNFTLENEEHPMIVFGIGYSF
ncbi:hypothetical protein Fsol_00569 [Candidatus Fokinia solitaria]|uniref:Uncharacterized protein n=1 Tax=Candidatus Fokinia solitaria TaxID=1802984 RepID=A0A2U8BSM0_9RICK|nr:hypothetical protein [Candidatus Fokinia solitaria]AWD33356.1 hypothetical protein Fsol_00569 [Candidatus Fokinia solitaria]